METLNNFLDYVVTNWEYLPLSTALMAGMAGIFRLLRNWLDSRSPNVRTFIKQAGVVLGAVGVTVGGYFLYDTQLQDALPQAFTLATLAFLQWSGIAKPVAQKRATTKAKLAYYDEQMRAAQVEEPAEPDPALFVAQ